MEIEVYHFPGQYVYLDMHGLATLLNTVEFSEPEEVAKAIKELVEAHRQMKEIEHEIRRAIASGKIKINNEIRRALEEIRKNEEIYSKYSPELETKPKAETEERSENEETQEGSGSEISEALLNTIGE